MFYVILRFVPAFRLAFRFVLWCVASRPGASSRVSFRFVLFGHMFLLHFHEVLHTRQASIASCRAQVVLTPSCESGLLCGNVGGVWPSAARHHRRTARVGTTRALSHRRAIIGQRRSQLYLFAWCRRSSLWQMGPQHGCRRSSLWHMER